MAVFTLIHGSAIGKDASGTPISVALSPGPGDFSIPDNEAGGYEVIDVYSRGQFLEGVQGQMKAQDVSFTLFQDGKITSVGTAQPADLVLKQGQFLGGATVDPGGIVWAVNLVLTLNRGGSISTCTITNWRGKVSFSEDAGGNKLAFSGRAAGYGATPAVVWS